LVAADHGAAHRDDRFGRSILAEGDAAIFFLRDEVARVFAIAYQTPDKSIGMDLGDSAVTRSSPLMVMSSSMNPPDKVCSASSTRAARDCETVRLRHAGAKETGPRRPDVDRQIALERHCHYGCWKS
jgi:hypothetical protein